MQFLSRLKERLARQNNCKGFTLVELLVGTVVSGIVIAGALGTYFTFGRNAGVQREIATMMENQRGAFSFLELNVRMAGFDPLPSATGITGIDIVSGGVLRINSDRNGSGAVGPNPDPSLSEQLAFALYDDGLDGITDLGVTGQVGAVPVLVAEGITAFGFAFAIDNDGNGVIDTTPAGNTIWAADIDGDNVLDVNLDTDDDGDVDINDADNGVALPAPAAVNTIRMVRIWVLSQTLQPSRRCIGLNQNVFYKVGPVRFQDPDNCTRFRLGVQTYDCRNM